MTWLVLLLMGRVADTSFMGLIVLAMGVQFALTGLRQFGPEVIERSDVRVGSEAAVSAMLTLSPLFLVYRTDRRVGPGRST